jgi:hypothetical protein
MVHVYWSWMDVLRLACTFLPTRNEATPPAAHHRISLASKYPSDHVTKESVRTRQAVPAALDDRVWSCPSLTAAQAVCAVDTNATSRRSGFAATCSQSRTDGDSGNSKMRLLRCGGRPSTRGRQPPFVIELLLDRFLSVLQFPATPADGRHSQCAARRISPECGLHPRGISTG